MDAQDLLFSMDIGTRTVVGIVGYHDGEKFNIVAYEVEEHKERAMYDGQVHDIELVAKAAMKVKQRLEHKLDIKLKHVAIAAAGRSLKTHKAFFERKVDQGSEISREDISSLEIEAIQKAQMDVEEMQLDDEHQYYCVGYAVINYYLNGGIISNLEGHRANTIGVEVLATFLPKIVIDGLYSVVARLDLEVSNLTLEPIAAMNVCIQSNLRLLNIALVDIGAGTSDIALTKGGTVFAFAMVPTAGDEITEKIAENYLLDFDTAEKVKINLFKKAKLKVKDIMGNSLQITKDELKEIIYPAVFQLAKEICDKIVEYNGKAPSAVFLVGGGSLVLGLEEQIAQQLQISLERVGIRKTSVIKDVITNDKKISGPEYITPIGIAVTAYMNRQKDFLNVYVNDKSIKLLNSKALTVADALILAGFNPRKLIGRRGASLSFTVNGKQELIKGELGEPAKIFVNGMQSSLDRVILNGDRIIIDPAVDGKNGEACLKSYANYSRGKIVYVNKSEHILNGIITVNGKQQDIGYMIQDKDAIEIKSIGTIKELFTYLSIEENGLIIEKNGEAAELLSTVQNGDIITWSIDSKSSTVENCQAIVDEISVTINNQEFKLKQTKEGLMFLDIFNYIHVDVSKIKGIEKMQINGKRANYMDRIQNGDIIEIIWEE